LVAQVVALGTLCGSLALIFMTPAAAQSARPRGPEASKIYYNKRNFRIPFNASSETRDRVKEIHLLVSEDKGYHWERRSKTFPDHPAFTFRTAHDGEYWFAVQTVTNTGKFAPPAVDSTIEPSMVVVVDTRPPSIELIAGDRRGSKASVRWEVKDEHLDPKSLVLEYQVEGVGVWRQVPIRQPALIGSQAWDAGTAEALKVRASVADKAGNVNEATIELPEGTASESDMAASDTAETDPLSIERISGGGSSEIMAGPDFTPISSEPPARKPTPVRSSRSRGRTTDLVARTPRAGSTAAGADTPSRSDTPATNLFATAGDGRSLDAPRPATTELSPSPGAESGPKSTSGRDGGGTLLVASPRFRLQYAVDDAGPGGPATVELWLTQDGGRTWIRRGDDPDRVSPIEVDLGGEGTFGICLVARSSSGLGDQPPAPGDPPQSWVEVDSTAPTVQLQAPQIGTGTNSGKVAIAWRASDLHLVPRSVALFWRPDQPSANWEPIANGQENIGQFIWTVPPTVPPRFHIKVEATDTLGHHGSAETTDLGAITVDRSRPRSRIIGLDSEARAGANPSARPRR
jgi:hypothetical protein